MGKTSIAWTDMTVNPIRARNLETSNVGHFCEKISPGCAHCYAGTWNAGRKHGTTVGGTGLDYLPVNRDKVELFFDESKLQEVLRRKKPTKWFWCDMTDLFGEWVPDEWIDRCFATMAMTPHHVHQVLTKRAERMRDYVSRADSGEVWDRWEQYATDISGSPRASGIVADAVFPLSNVQLGVSVESQPYADERIPWLLQTPAAVRFLSIEPCLGPVDLGRWLNDGQRKGIFSPDGAGLVFNRLGRSNLEAHRIRGWTNASNEMDSEPASGCQREQGLRLSESDVSRQGGAAPGGGPSNNLDVGKQGDDTGCDGGQPQGRREVEQPSLESRIDDQAGKRETRNPRSEVQKAKGAARPGQRGCEANRGPGDGDSGSRGSQGDVPTGNRGEVRPNAERGIGHPPAQELGALGWIIIGGESGKHLANGQHPERWMKDEWARSLVQQCRAAGVPVFYKQGSGVRSGMHEELDGKVIREYPANADAEGRP